MKEAQRLAKKKEKDRLAREKEEGVARAELQARAASEAKAREDRQTTRDQYAIEKVPILMPCWLTYKKTKIQSHTKQESYFFFCFHGYSRPSPLLLDNPAP